MKTVLITGASRGIGRAIAKEFAKKGYNVCINCVRERARLDELSAEIQSLGTNAADYSGFGVAEHNGANASGLNGAGVAEYIGDVSDVEFVKDMFADIKKRFGGIDVLVNNAGISLVGLFTDMSDENWRHICGVNLDGVIWCSREAARLMIENKSGKIINISSMWGQVGASCEVAYSATKGAVDAFTKALAKELAPSNIQVNAVSCGVIDTDMNKCFTEEERAALMEEIPAGRFGTPEEVAELVVSLCEGKEYLTGQIIRMDGGMI